ncbi:MAG: DMT family transporter [Lachnospiraceae bacterium]
MNSKGNVSTKTQGIFFIIMAGFFFALMTFFVRLSGDLPTMQKALFRNLVAVAVSAVMLKKEHISLNIDKPCRIPLFLRCFCGTAGLICNFYAIDRLNIADANMLNKLSPFFAVLLSGWILKEKANKVEWATMFLAFAGALFVMKPSFHMEFVYALIGALGGFGAGMAYTYVRKLGKMGVKGPIIVFCFSAFSVLVTLPFTIAGYQPMEPKQLLSLLMAGVAATGGQLCITTAYTKAPAREISVFDYCQILFAALLGFVFFHELPDVWSVIGYIIIIGTAILKWYYNLKYTEPT